MKIAMTDLMVKIISIATAKFQARFTSGLIFNNYETHLSLISSILQHQWKLNLKIIKLVEETFIIMASGYPINLISQILINFEMDHCRRILHHQINSVLPQQLR